MKKQEKELIEEIERLEYLKDFFKKELILYKRVVENLNYARHEDKTKFLRGLNWFQKLIIGYDKLNKSYGKDRYHYTRVKSTTYFSGGTNESLDRGNAKANKDFQAVWGEGSGEGFY